MKILSKETEYKGITFRSKLESLYAKLFDDNNIKYSYEIEGYDLGDGVWYLPDFYLPDMNCFFECKGVMDDRDEEKIKRLCNQSGKNVYVGYYPVPNKIEEYSFDYWDNEVHISKEIVFFKCEKCKKIFLGTWGRNFECKCCGEYEGDHHLMFAIEAECIEKLNNLCERVIIG